MSSETFELPERCRSCLYVQSRLYTLEAARQNSARAPEIVSVMFRVGEALAQIDPEADDSSQIGDMEGYMRGVDAEQAHWDGYVALGESGMRQIVAACPGSTSQVEPYIEGLGDGHPEVTIEAVQVCGVPAGDWNSYDGTMQAYLAGENE